MSNQKQTEQNQTQPPKLRFGSYKGILEKLQELDEEERKDLSLRLKIIYWGAGWAVFLLVVLAIRLDDYTIFFSKESITVLLIPAFSYLYTSYQDDVYSARKSALLKFLIENFDEDDSFEKYAPRQMGIEKIEELIDSLFKAKF